MGHPKVRNMEEFASLSGISRPTISKYFNDPDSVRPTTRAKIEASLKKHDYQPNVFAMNQNRRTTKNIGVVVPNLADPFFSEIGRRRRASCWPPSGGCPMWMRCAALMMISPWCCLTPI